MLSLSMIHSSPQGAAHPGEPRHREPPRQPQLHHDDLRGGRPGPRTLTYARAGHTPLMHYRGDATAVRMVDVLAPDGIVLGLAHRGRGGALRAVARGVHDPAARRRRVRAVHRRHHRGDERRRPTCSARSGCATSSPSTGTCRRTNCASASCARSRRSSGGADQHDDMTMILLKVEPSSSSRLLRRRLGRGPGVTMPDTVVIFRTRSDVEAAIVRGPARDARHRGAWSPPTCRTPSSRCRSPASARCGSRVYAEEADDARQLIESSPRHEPDRAGAGAALARRARRGWRTRLGYRFRRPRAARAGAHAPVARARGPERRDDGQRVARVPRRRGARASSWPTGSTTLPGVRRRAEVEDEGVARVRAVARAHRGPPRDSATTCCSAAARRRPAGGRSRRCWPTRARR